MTSLMLMTMIIASYINGMKPSDIEVLINDSAYISCSPNASIDIQWHFDSYSNYVFAGGRFFIPYRGRFRIEMDSTAGMYILIIPDVKPEDAGVYYCSEELSGREISSTHLTVLYSNPVCNSTMSPDGFVGSNTCGLQQENMTFNCSVSFRGKAPSLIWKSVNNSQTFNGTTCDYKSNRANCSLTLKPDLVYHGSVFSCETAERNESLHKCNTEIIKISYFFAKYDAREEKVNENVSCEVTSNLNVKYNWTLKQDNEETYLSSNRVILIQEPGIYQCEVEYSIRNATCSALVSTVNITTEITNIPNEQGINVLAMTLPIVAVVIIVITLIAAVFFRYIIRRERRIRGEFLEKERELREQQEQELRQQLLEERELREREQDLSERKRENERLKSRVIKMYNWIVTDVDPMDVLDLLIEKGVIDIELKEVLMAKETREDRCRTLLDHLLDSSSDETFIVLREALKENRYHEIIEAIDTSDETGGICNPASVKFLKKLQLPVFSSTTFICGITKLPNRIYVLCNEPKYVVVFSDRMPFEFMESIRMEEIEFPSDIASSRKSECLYIVDNKLKIIWEKKTTDYSPLTKWSVKLIEPVTLSISNDDRLLVLDGGDPANLVIIGLDGKLIQRISLPNEIQKPFHCIEKPNGGFIISEMSKISELSSDGKDIIRQYHPNDASEELNWPNYMSLDHDNDLLFVADLMNNRVIIIDSNSLQLKKIIITELLTPCSLLYDSNKSQLIVGQLYESVNVYNFNKTTNLN